METTDVREWHYLRPLKNTTVPQSIMIVDTETHMVKDAKKKGRVRHHLRLWCAEAFRLERGQETRVELGSGEDATSFWKFVASRADAKRPLWIFCHNAGFDMTTLALWQQATDGSVDFIQYGTGNKATKVATSGRCWVGIACLDDPPTILKFRLAGTTKTVVVVDTYNYYRTSLAKIGESIGMVKGQLPDASAGPAVWYDYCRQDVAILKAAVLSLVRLVVNEKLGGLAYTISGLAMNAYRKRFMPEGERILIHGNGEALKLERDSYHGGSCHCWYIGHVVTDAPSGGYFKEPHADMAWQLGPVYHLDIQSFYPSIMARSEFPCRLERVILCPTPAQLKHALCTSGVIASVRLDCQPPGYPVTRLGRTFYAAGRINTVLAYPELLRAASSGDIVSVFALASYGMAKLFTDFVEYFWAKRKHYRDSEQPALANVCKLILNSLYGKFGAYRQRWQEDSDVTAPVPFGNWYERKAGEAEARVYRALGWLPQRQHGRAEHPDSFPAISSYVTSYGREIILSHANVAGLANCYYSDTDSLHVNQQGYDNLQAAGLVKPGQLGFLQLVDTWPWSIYRGPKNYTTPAGNVIAGIKSDATLEPDGRYKQKKFQRLASVLAGEQHNSIAMEDVLIATADWYPTGTVAANGRVETVLLNEW